MSTTSKTASKLTGQQAQAVDLIRQRKNVFISAYAGTGKSMTGLTAASQLIKDGVKNGLIVAFNVKIRDELLKKLSARIGGRDPSDVGWEVRTVNSLGHGVLLANGYAGKKGNRLMVDTGKNRIIISEALRLKPVADILDAALTKEGREFKKSAGSTTAAYGSMLEAMLHAAKIYAVPLHSMNSSLLETLIGVASSQMNYPDGLLTATTDLAKVMERCLQLNLAMAREQHLIDFTDQIYLAARYCSHPGRRWNVIWADEIQDFSWSMHTLIQRSCSGQLVLSGDRYQAIFVKLLAASIESLDAAVDKYKMETVTLDRSFRCAQSICEKQVASGYLPSFEPFLKDKAPLGDIRMPLFQAAGLNESAEWTMPRLLASDPDGKRTMVLAGFNAGLIEFLALLWLTRRDLVKASALRYSGQKVPKAVWRQAAALSIGSRQSASLLTKACALFLRVTHMTPDEAEKLHDSLVASEATGTKLWLATVHTAKGAEADKVIIVNPHQLMDDAVTYVAETRARTELYSVVTAWYKAGKNFRGLLDSYNAWVKAPSPVSARKALSVALKSVPVRYRVGSETAKALFASSSQTPNLVTSASKKATAAVASTKKKPKKGKSRGRSKKPANNTRAGRRPRRNHLRKQRD